MKWLLENAWILIVIAGVAAQLMKAARTGQKGGEETPAPPKEYEFDDPELAERTRKIREEIRRKIEQRRGQAYQPQPVPPVVVEPSPEATPPPVMQLPRVVREVMIQRVPAPAPVRAETSAQAEEMERQNALAERLREAEIMREGAAKRAAFEAATADKEPALLAATRTTVLEDLREPAALRRAFILREVLGPPVALR